MFQADASKLLSASEQLTLHYKHVSFNVNNILHQSLISQLKEIQLLL